MQPDTAPNPQRVTAVVCDKHSPDAARMTEYLQSQGWAGRWHALRDLDEVDALAAEGRLERAVLMSWKDLLDGIWAGDVTYRNWLSNDVQVSFLNPPAGGTTESLAAVSQAWDAYYARRSRRNAVAGLVLSIIVILAAFAIIQCSA